ncbi:hypothetical protein CSUB01_12296 [Colletotrichum sublineola]|uniref:Uncharacterized protein n=1 Tax=Colletotrichum sublineola TaxID=1173701 RepID=A0A066XN00_COLSU|nr:hypothetical protein CSUB01_12296 [Colletotrichum sublineola]
MSTDQADDTLNPIAYNVQFRILICKLCRSCFRTSIYRHLQEYHNNTRHWSRKEVLEYEGRFRHYPIIQSSEDIKAIQVPQALILLSTYLWKRMDYSVLCVTTAARTSVVQHVEDRGEAENSKPSQPREANIRRAHGANCSFLHVDPVDGPRTAPSHGVPPEPLQPAGLQDLI